jgi:hypothetical protein
LRAGLRRVRRQGLWAVGNAKGREKIQRKGAKMQRTQQRGKKKPNIKAQRHEATKGRENFL